MNLSTLDGRGNKWTKQTEDNAAHGVDETVHTRHDISPSNDAGVGMGEGHHRVIVGLFLEGE